jgi:Icc-related predicted phosphoesterase
MAIRSESTAGAEQRDECAIRIAATGDIHVGREADAQRWAEAFAGLRDRVDLVLLAGDLTTHGEPEQGAMVAAAVRGIDVPVLAVLGNHDWHVNRCDELVAVLQQGGIDVLERDHRVLDLCGTEVGIAGCKGFGGGFDGAHIPDFGEPLMRSVYAESIREAEALDHALRAIALCPFRIALLHYAPITTTLQGERSDIWPFLGTDRLAAPLREHHPDLVLHGHAHAGTFQGALGGVPVYNVSVPVLGEDFWVFELTGARRMPSEVH